MIDIYFLFTQDFDAHDFLGYESYLNKEEQVARNRFVFKKDRDQYLLTRALTRKVLAQKLNCQPSELEFVKNEYGKPFLKNAPSDLTFNISHTSGLIIIGISEKGEILGIDIEDVSRKMDMDVIMPTVFIEDEIKELFELPQKEQRSRFFDLWTLKESYMKAVGKGFHLPPKTFSVSFQGDKYEFNENPQELSSSKFYFQLSDIDETYRMAICHSSAITSIRSFKVLPPWNTEEYDLF
jgi:4'-phosphopantetheinyl transferase